MKCAFILQKDICKSHPRPSGDPSKPLKALLFENWYDQFRGVVCLVNVIEGSLKRGKFFILILLLARPDQSGLSCNVGDKIVAASSNKTYELENVGILFPERVPTGALYACPNLAHLLTNLILCKLYWTSWIHNWRDAQY